MYSFHDGYRVEHIFLTFTDWNFFLSALLLRRLPIPPGNVIPRASEPAISVQSKPICSFHEMEVDVHVRSVQGENPEFVGGFRTILISERKT